MERIGWAVFLTSKWNISHSKYNEFHHLQHTEEPDIIIETYHPYGTQKKNTLDDINDIRDASELKFNKNPLPKDILSSKNVNSSPDKK